MTLIMRMPGGRNTATASVVFRVNIAKSCALLEEHIKAHNEAQTENKLKLKAVHFTLAKKLLELYAGRFAAWQTQNYYSFTNDTPLPYLRINNESLAEWLICTDRTIRNYRAKLVEIGFISETIWHGPARPYEIRLNPAFLWMAVNTTTDRVVLPNGRIFPLTGSCNLKPELTGTVSGKKQEPSISVVDVVSVQEQPEPVNGNESQENQAPFGATGTLIGTPPSCATPPPPPPSSREQRRAGRALLVYALPLLYPKKRYWTAAEKGQMEAQVAQLFEGVTELNINRVMDNYCLRVLMAAHHYKRVSGVPIPYPWVFFNPSSEHGFSATRYWPQYPEKFPVTRARSTPKVRVVAKNNTGQIQIGQLFEMMEQ